MTFKSNFAMTRIFGIKKLKAFVFAHYTKLITHAYLSNQEVSEFFGETIVTKAVLKVAYTLQRDI